MAPKRKSDQVDLDLTVVHSADDTGSSQAVAPAKRARKSNTTEDPSAASTSETKGKEKSTKPQSWQEVNFDGEDEGSIPVYDDCADIRRKIGLLQKTPGFKVTHWLKDIGGINSNSLNRFMKEKGKTDGAANGTYYAAYVYFEKVRILEGKKKTAKRESNELAHPHGFPLENRRRGWVMGR